MRTKLLDASAVALAALCMLHCLAPIAVIAGVPALSGAVDVPESFHLVAVVAAALVTLPVIWMRRSSAGFAVFARLAGAGLVSLAAALFMPSEALETIFTTLGGVLLATAHLRNWRGHTHQPA